MSLIPAVLSFMEVENHMDFFQLPPILLSPMEGIFASAVLIYVPHMLKVIFGKFNNAEPRSVSNTGIAARADAAHKNQLEVRLFQHFEKSFRPSPKAPTLVLRRAYSNSREFISSARHTLRRSLKSPSPFYVHSKWE